MKKILFSFGLVALFGGVAHAQILPSSALVDLVVTNVAKENQDAQRVGARPGDVLRYELYINSATEDVVDFIPVFDISQIMQSAEIVSMEGARIEGNSLIFDAYSQQAPCEKSFTFFVRVKPDCGGLMNINTEANGMWNAMVPLECGPGAIARVGSSTSWILALAVALGLVLVVQIGSSARRRS